MRKDCKVKSKVAVKEMLICQGFPETWATLLFNQIYVLHFCLIDCETVVVETFAGEY